MKIITYPIRSSSGRITCHFNPETKVLERRLRGSSHLLRSPLAICFDACIVAQAQDLDCKEILVSDVETGTRYSVPFSVFLDKSFPLNRGFGEQLALPLSYWLREGGFTPAPHYTMAEASEPEKPRIRQLGLF